MAKPLSHTLAAPHELSRPRVRRGNQSDAEQLRAELIDAAMQLFSEGGLAAVSLRAVAARVGVSPMAMYRYFADKSELLSGLWLSVVHDLCEALKVAVEPHQSARARHRALTEAFLHYWESHPDHYCLVYGFTDLRREREAKSRVGQAPVYAELRALAFDITEALAVELGADPAQAKLASDMRLAMLLGYLHGTLVATRYPWGDTQALRAAYLAQVDAAVERTLRGEGPPA